MIKRIEEILKNKLVRKIVYALSVSFGFGSAISVVACFILALFVHWAWVFAIDLCLIAAGVSFGIADYLDSVW